MCRIRGRICLDFLRVGKHATILTVRLPDGPEHVPDGRDRLLARIDRALNVFDKPGVVLVLLLPVVLQWIVPLVRSRFWLDEAVTWWTTNQGLRELVTRCTFWPGSILYNSFILLLRSAGVHCEWLLRLPSLAAVMLSAAVCFDLARRWFSRRVAIAALVFFCAQPWVAFAAADARPYGLGLLMVMTATWLMLRWLELRRATVACAYGAAAALVLHFHMLFGTVLVFHGIFLALVLPRNRQVVRQAAMAVSILAVLALPLLPQYVYAFTGRAAHTFANPRSLWDLCRQFLPTLPMLAAALIAAMLPRSRPARREAIVPKSILLALLWAGVPMCLLYVAAKLSGSDLFVGRYLLPYVPGIALCFGLVLEYWSPRVRTGLVLLIFLMPVGIGCWRGQFASHTSRGNWAAAIEYIDRENRHAPLPAMMRSPFPESDFFEWRKAKMNDSALYAPLVFYQSSSQWYPLPATFTPEAARAIDNLVQIQSATRHGLFFASYEDPKTADPYLAYFRAYFRNQAGARGEFQEVGNFEGIRVFRLRW